MQSEEVEKTDDSSRGSHSGPSCGGMGGGWEHNRHLNSSALRRKERKRDDPIASTARTSRGNQGQSKLLCAAAHQHKTETGPARI